MQVRQGEERCGVWSERHEVDRSLEVSSCSSASRRTAAHDLQIFV